MGTWGAGLFENDAAWDWLEELVASEDPSLAERCIRSINEMDEGYLDADLGAEGLAAGCAIAVLGAHGGDKEPESLLEWATVHASSPSPALLASARAAVERIARWPGSELASQWRNSELESHWNANVNDLIGRLR